VDGGGGCVHGGRPDVRQDRSAQGNGPTS
jgi:hypothetical protein